MYNETDYLTSDILNYVESKVRKLNNKYSDYIQTEYNSKVWEDNEFVCVDDIANIENYIEMVGNDLGYPTGWEVSKNWNLKGENNISYRDVNRWLKNVELLLSYETNPLVPSENLYPKGNFLYPNTTIYPDETLYSLYGDVLLPSNRKEMQ